MYTKDFSYFTANAHALKHNLDTAGLTKNDSKVSNNNE